MRVKTVVINGDPSWPFADLVWAHALDLYPPSSDVSFISAVQAEDAQGQDDNIRRLLGNFPEVFSNGSTGLADEIASEVINFSNNDVGRLSILAVISQRDFDTLAALPAVQGGLVLDDVLGLSASGRATLRALRRAIDVIGVLSGDKGQIADLFAKLWLSLCVRDRGFEPEHDTDARRVMHHLSGQSAHVRTTFLLSNGRGLDSGVDDHHLHFVKLRLLLDILKSASNADIAKDLMANETDAALRGMQDGGTSRGRVFSVRLPRGTPPYLAHSSALLNALVAAYDDLSGQSSTHVPAADSAFIKRFEGIKNDLYDAMSIGAAEEQLTAELDAKEQKAAKDMQWIEQEIAGLRRRRLGPLLHSQKRVKDYVTTTQNLENTLHDLALACDRVTDDFVVAHLEDRARRKKLLMHGLDELGRPQSYDLLLEARAFADRKAAEIARSVAQNIAVTPKEDDDALKTRTTEHLENLVAAEDRLTRFSSLLRIPFLLLVVLGLPILILVIGRYVLGTLRSFSWQTISENAWPLPLILGGCLALSILAGLTLALTLARNRDKARRQLGQTLRERYDLTLSKSAAQVARLDARNALSFVRLLQSQLELDDGRAMDAATNSFLDRLRNISTHKDGGDTRFAGVVSNALKGFSRGNLRQDKVRTYLSSIPDLPKSELVVELPGTERRTTVETQAAPDAPGLTLEKAGNV